MSAEAAPGAGLGGQGRPTVTWRESVLVRAVELEALLAWFMSSTGGRSAGGGADAELLRVAVRRHLDAAREAALRTQAWPVRRLRLRWTGADLERAVSNLDAAEALMLQLAPLSYVRGQLPRLLVQIRQLGVEDPRRLTAERVLREVELRDLNEVDRGYVVAAVRAAASVDMRHWTRVRSFRNMVVVTTLLELVLALAMAVVGALSPASLPMCFAVEGSAVCPTGSQPLPAAGTVTGRPGDLALVELVGMLGASLAAVAGLRRSRGISRYGLAVWLSALKLPTGAITAVLGLMLLGSGFVPGLRLLPSSAQILAWAVVFGYAQQIFTGLVDRQALAVLDSQPVGAGGSAASAEALEGAVRTVLQTSFTPVRLVNYRGVLSIRLVGDGGRAVPPDEAGRFPVTPGERVSVLVTIGPDAVRGAQHVPVDIRDGDPAERVPFAVELIPESGPGWGETPLDVVAAEAFETAELQVPVTMGADSTLWVRLSQRGSLIQVVEVELAARERSR